MRQDARALIEPIVARTAQAPLTAGPVTPGEARVSLMVTGLVPSCWNCHAPLAGNAKLIVTRPDPSSVREENGQILDHRGVLLLCPSCDQQILLFRGTLHYQT